MTENEWQPMSGEHPQADRAFVADAIEPVPVSPVPASIPCAAELRANIAAFRSWLISSDEQSRGRSGGIEQRVFDLSEIVRRSTASLFAAMESVAIAMEAQRGETVEPGSIEDKSAGLQGIAESATLDPTGEKA